MKLAPTYCLLVVSCSAFFLGSSCGDAAARKMPMMDPRYIYKDKGPMGTFMSYRLLSQQFTGALVVPTRKIGQYFDAWAAVTNTTYIIICETVNLTATEKNNVLNYVEKGNELFIAAENIDAGLLEMLQVKTPFVGTSFLKEDTYVTLTENDFSKENKYGFFYYAFNQYFKTAADAPKCLGLNANHLPNFIGMKYGKGKLFLQVAPATFSNYFLLKDDNLAYYKKAFSYLNEKSDTVYWGNALLFAATASPENSSEKKPSWLGMFLKNPPLLYALVLASLLTLLYIAFNSKRKYPMIAVLEGNTNATLSFVKSITNLYLEKKDNCHIASKMIAYFFEEIRVQYYVENKVINEEFMRALSRKRGIEAQNVFQLMQLINRVNNRNSLTDAELLDLKHRLQAFHPKNT